MKKGSPQYRPRKTNSKPPADLIFGARAVMEAMEAGRDIDKIMVRPGLDSELRKDVVDLAGELNIPVQQVPAERIDKMLRGHNHQGVVARIALVPFVDLEELLVSVREKGETPLLVALDQVSDVRNFGAIARTAECMGAHGIVVAQQGAAQINGEAIKISAGALHHLPVARVAHLQDMVYLVQSYGLRVVGCTEKAEEQIFAADLTQPTVLIFGAEDKGISPRIQKSADQLIKVPMLGKIASLNVSVAVGMVMAEVTRQRYFSE